MKIVVALGGNALLLPRDEPGVEAERRNVARAAISLAPLASDNELTITHGNGPQVGLLALQAEASPETGRWPLDVLDAESEGMMGYLIEQALRAALPDREVATLLTQVLVDADDPAFDNPTKPIGPRYDASAATALVAERGWCLAPEGGHWRRVVPSPEPKTIIELAAIQLLLAANVICICVGGGGIPVVAEDGRLVGVEAVIDKDLAAALLALELGADELVLLTDVDGIYEDWPAKRRGPIREATPATLRTLSLPAGSMGPKALAASRFCEASGRPARIGRLDQVTDILAGRAGTTVRCSHSPS